MTSWDKQLLAAVLANTDLEEQDAKAFLENQAGAAARRSFLQLQWVRNLHRVTSAIAGGTARPFGMFKSVFWIRLYGVVVELRMSSKDSADIHREATAAGEQIPPLLRLGARIYPACVEVKDAMTEDELVFLAMARHTEAHLAQHGLAYGLERQGKAKRVNKVRTETLVATMDRRLAVDQIDRAIERLLTARGDEKKIALEIAERVRVPIADLVAVVEALHALK